MTGPANPTRAALESLVEKVARKAQAARRSAAAGYPTRCAADLRELRNAAMRALTLADAMAESLDATQAPESIEASHATP